MEALKRRRVQGVSNAVPRDQWLSGLYWNGVGNEMHMVTQHADYTAERQRHPHLFDELGGWQQVTGQQVWDGPTTSNSFMHA